MDETHLPPPPPVQAASPSSMKLSDLNVIKQQIVTRAGITLTAIGLLATASETIGRLLPDLGDAASQPYPVGVYLAAVFLPLGAIYAVSALDLSPDLQSVLVTRLKAAEGPSDAVSAELQSLFVQNIERCLQEVNRAKNGLIWGSVALLLHAYLVILIHITVDHKLPAVIRKLFYNTTPDFAVEYYFVSIAIVLGVAVLEAHKHFRICKAGRQRSPPPAIGKEPDLP